MPPRPPLATQLGTVPKSPPPYLALERPPAVSSTPTLQASLDMGAGLSQTAQQDTETTQTEGVGCTTRLSTAQPARRVLMHAPTEMNT